MFSLKLFGVVSLAGENGPLTGPATQRRRLALLALIAAGPEAGTGRDRITALLWPDVDSDQARRYLADSLYALRRAMGAQSILAAGDNLQLDPSIVTCDVVEFRRAFARGDHEAAAALYTGAFLEGFVVSDAAELEQWADGVREELARQRAGALEHLAHAAETLGDFVQAATWWRQLQTADPLNSRVALRLMTALDTSGDPAAALRHAHVHETLLREELNVAPPDAIAALVARIRTASAPRSVTDARASKAEPETEARRMDSSPSSVADTSASVAASSWTAPASLSAADASSSTTDASSLVADESSSTSDGSSHDANVPSVASDASPLAEAVSRFTGFSTAAAEPQAAVVDTRRTRRKSRTRRGVLALALLVAVGLPAVVASLRDGPRDERPRVLVTAFENRTGDAAHDVIGSMAADWIARALRDAGVLDVISPTWSIYAAGNAAARGGATTLVAGSYYTERGGLRIEAQIVDASSGTILHALEPVTVASDSATAGVEMLRQRVTAALAARFGTLRELREITVRSQPPILAAYVDYVQGVQQFSNFRTQEAARLFDRAWRADSSFHLAALYGILVAYNTGNRTRGDSLVLALSLRRERMVPFDRALLATFEAEMNGDVHGLLRAMRTVATMAPGSQFAVGHAVAAVAANRPGEALRTLEQLDPAVGLLRNNPRYWEWLTASRHLLGQHCAELRDARAARAQHPRLAAALVQEVRALAALRRVTEVEQLLDEAASLPDGAMTPGDVMRAAAAELRAHDEPAAAARALDRAIAWYRARQSDPRHRGALARALYEAGRLDEAHALFTGPAAAERSGISDAAHLALIAARKGRREEAAALSAALAAGEGAASRGSVPLWRARIAARLGDTPQALELLHAAFAQGVAHGLWLHTDSDLASLHREAEFRRQLRPTD